MEKEISSISIESLLGISIEDIKSNTGQIFANQILQYFYWYKRDAGIAFQYHSEALKLINQHPIKVHKLSIALLKQYHLGMIYLANQKKWSEAWKLHQELQSKRFTTNVESILQQVYCLTRPIQICLETKDKEKGIGLIKTLKKNQ